MLIEGRLKLDTWEGQDGQKRSKLKVVCDRMQMLGGRGGGQGGADGGPRPAARQQARNPQYSQPAPPDDYQDAPPAGEPPAGDDIPF